MRKLLFILIVATLLLSPAVFAHATATGTTTTVAIGARGHDHREQLHSSLWDDVHGQRDVTSEGVR